MRAQGGSLGWVRCAQGARGARALYEPLGAGEAAERVRGDSAVSSAQALKFTPLFDKMSALSCVEQYVASFYDVSLVAYL